MGTDLDSHLHKKTASLLHRFNIILPTDIAISSD